MNWMKNLLERRNFSFCTYTLTSGPRLEVSRDSQYHPPRLSRLRSTGTYAESSLMQLTPLKPP